jgi:hypothetical protein
MGMIVRASTTGGQLGDAPQYGACSDNQQDSLVQGAILHCMHLAQFYHKPKNITFPLIKTAGI